MNRFVLHAHRMTSSCFSDGRTAILTGCAAAPEPDAAKNKTGVSNDDVRVVRFEGKQKHRGLMSVLPLAWDEYDSILEETTVNGIQIYFPVAGKAGAVITGNDQSAVNKKDYSGTAQRV